MSTWPSRTPASAAKRGFFEDTPSTGATWSSRTCSEPRSRSAPRSEQLIGNRGHLLLTSSVAGRRVLPGSLYSCTKHAVTAMGEAARQELHDKGVRVT